MANHSSQHSRPFLRLWNAMPHGCRGTAPPRPHQPPALALKTAVHYLGGFPTLLQAVPPFPRHSGGAGSDSLGIQNRRWSCGTCAALATSISSCDGAIVNTSSFSARGGRYSTLPKGCGPMATATKNGGCHYWATATLGLGIVLATALGVSAAEGSNYSTPPASTVLRPTTTAAYHRYFPSTFAPRLRLANCIATCPALCSAQVATIGIYPALLFAVAALRICRARLGGMVTIISALAFVAGCYYLPYYSNAVAISATALCHVPATIFRAHASRSPPAAIISTPYHNLPAPLAGGESRSCHFL